eukprot:10340023-Heterocapsa_arctica.AAC.1
MGALLGDEVTVSAILLPVYWKYLLAEMGITSYKSVSTSTELNDKPDGNSPLLGNADHTIFRRAVGKALYGCSGMPDLS